MDLFIDFARPHLASCGFSKKCVFFYFRLWMVLFLIWLFFFILWLSFNRTVWLPAYFPNLHPTHFLLLFFSPHSHIFNSPFNTHTHTYTHTFLNFPSSSSRCLIAYSFFYFQLCGHYFAILSALLPRPDLHVGGLNSVVLIEWLVYTPHGNHSSLKMSTLRLTGLTVRHNVWSSSLGCW